MTREELVGLFLAGAARFITGATPRWVNCLPDTRQRIYFANHGSHFDLLLLWSALPRDIRRKTRPIAARDYWMRNALKRYLAYRVFNGIPIDRDGHGAGFRAPLESVHATLDGMGSEYSLIIFPEGTRGQAERIAPFRGGVYHIARARPGIELVPVFMENLSRVLPKGEILPVPILGSITFGEPIHVRDGERKPDFLERARRTLCELGEIPA